jgi:uncharacterized protein YbjQ (UPF0145 family)
MSGPADAPAGRDLAAEVRRAIAFLEHPPTRGLEPTSDLTIDEELIVHSIGWEPVELVSGLSMVSIPWSATVWSWGQGAITPASSAYEMAFGAAIARIHAQAAEAGGHGVVGVTVERAVHASFVDITLTGTAVRPIGAPAVPPDDIFVSDLSARDFALLTIAGWRPLALVQGASFVYAPRRSVGAVIQQRTQNVELTNYTEAMYNARETAMERMQSMALAVNASGVVEVKVAEGPMPFASHAVAFSAWGTAVRRSDTPGRRIDPAIVVSLDDPTLLFDAANLE